MAPANLKGYYSNASKSEYEARNEPTVKPAGHNACVLGDATYYSRQAGYSIIVSSTSERGAAGMPVPFGICL